jgi:hypothetical protein
MVALTPLEELSRKMSRDASEKMILRPWEQEHPERASEQMNTQALLSNTYYGSQNGSVT